MDSAQAESGLGGFLQSSIQSITPVAKLIFDFDTEKERLEVEKIKAMSNQTNLRQTSTGVPAPIQEVKNPVEKSKNIMENFSNKDILTYGVGIAVLGFVAVLSLRD